MLQMTREDTPGLWEFAQRLRTALTEIASRQLKPTLILAGLDDWQRFGFDLQRMRDADDSPEDFLTTLFGMPLRGVSNNDTLLLTGPEFGRYFVLPPPDEDACRWLAEYCLPVAMDAREKTTDGPAPFDEETLVRICELREKMFTLNAIPAIEELPWVRQARMMANIVEVLTTEGSTLCLTEQEIFAYRHKES